MALKLPLSILIGYLLGSLSPAYLAGRFLKGGVRTKVLTALFDAGKGIAAVSIARYVLHLDELWTFAAGYAAVAGHIFPFYLRFRGGQATATASGLYLFFCALAISRGDFALGSLLAVLTVTLLLVLASRSGDLTGLAAFAFLVILTPLEMGLTPAGIGLLIPALYLFAVSLWSCLRNRVFRFSTQKEMKWWRIIARPFALLFIPIDRFFHRTPLLFLLGALGVIFIGMDLFRMLTRYQLRQLFKKSETKRFSSMTTFLVAIFIIFLVFPGSIPYLGLAFITIGDMFGKIIGIRFGKRELLKGRTLEGTLAFAAGGFLAAWVLYVAMPMPAIPLYAVIAGPLFASAVELFSANLDDNFTVGVISSGFLYALKYFLKS